MQEVILIIHILLAIVMVAVILLQRSEGGALGIGGGGGGGGLISTRGAANLLTRATAILAGLFFLTSIGLTILSKSSTHASSVLDTSTQQSTQQPSGSAPNLPNTALPKSAPEPSTNAAPQTAPSEPAAPTEPQVPTGK
jgi:preprotein translocase subunit SecG